MQNEIILKHYSNKKINDELRKMFEMAVKDDEYEERFNCGGDFECLMEQIDKVINYVNNGCIGELRLNDNMWYICQETLYNILDLYGLELEMEYKHSENTLVLKKENGNIINLVEKIIKYTTTWSITENEWYWNIDCVRKSSNVNEKNITQHEFEVAIREEILFDLIYNNGACTCDQMENDLCNYEEDNTLFREESEKLEKEIQKFIKSFKIERYYRVDK